MNWEKILSGWLVSVIALSVMCLCAFAEESSAVLRLKSSETKVKTGDTVKLTVIVEQTDQPLLGVLLDLEMAEGFQFSDVVPGKDIETNELSYHFTGSELIVVYMDNDVGGSAARQGAELMEIRLTAVSPVSGQPLNCLQTDVVGGTRTTDIQMAASLEMDSVTAKGEEVVTEAPQPIFVEEGKTVETETPITTEIQPEATGQTGKTVSSSEAVQSDELDKTTTAEEKTSPSQDTEEKKTESKTEPLDIQNGQPGQNQGVHDVRWLVAAVAVLVTGFGIAAIWIGIKKKKP